MKAILKFEINQINSSAMMPVGAKLLTAQGQKDTICVWAEVDTDAPSERVPFDVFGTGRIIPEGMGIDREYVGTAQIHDGDLVFHVYKYTGI